MTTVDRSSVWSIFYRSIKSPKDLSADFKLSNERRYFWHLCGLYLCLPMLIILTVAYTTGLLEESEALIIGAQVAVLLPLLFLSVWLLGKLVPRIAKPDKQESIRSLYWLLASNYFFMLFGPLALLVLLANLVPHSILDNPLISIAIPLVFVVGAILWLRSSVLLIQCQMRSNRNRAIVIAICGALLVTISAWLVIGIIGLLILVPIGLSV